MAAHAFFFMTLMLSQLLRAKAGATTVGTSELATTDYVAGSSGTSISIPVTFVSGVDTNGDTIVFTFNNALLATSATPSVTVSGGSTPTFTYATNAGGTTLTCTLTGGSITGGAATFVIPLGTSLPSAGEQTVTVVATSSNTGGDGGTATTLFYTIPTPTFTLTSADMVAATTPSQLQIVIKTPFALSSSDPIKVVLGKRILASSVTDSGLTVSGATFSTYSTNSNGDELTATLSGAVNADTQITLVLGSALMTALPDSFGTISGTIKMDRPSDSSETAVGGVSSFGTITPTQSTPTITLDSSNMRAGTVPISLQVVQTCTFALTSGQTIVVTGSAAIFAASVSDSGLTLSGTTFSSYSTNAQGTAFTGTLSANVADNTNVDMTFGAALMPGLPNAHGDVTITVATNGHTVGTSTNGFGFIVGRSLFGNDPIAQLGDVRREFELPPGVMTTLLQAPDFQMRGTVFEGGGPWEQWFNRIVLTVPWQDRFLEIKIRENLQDFNFSKVPRSAFQTLDITMGYSRYGSGRAVTKISDFHEVVPWDFLAHEITFRKVKRHYPAEVTTIGKFPRECVDAAGKYMHFYICSAPSTEYYGHQRDLSLKYAHLDVAFVEVVDYQALTGLLPELWGVQPMTESTKAFVKEEKPHAQQVTMESSVKATAWAGGPDVKNLTQSCFEPKETAPDKILAV